MGAHAAACGLHQAVLGTNAQDRPGDAMTTDEPSHRQKLTVHGREPIHDGFIRLERCDVEVEAGRRRARFVREVHDHGMGAAVLPVDAGRRTALLVGQVRVPVALVAGDGFLLEAAAGLVEADDPDPSAAAAREAREELGVVVRDLLHVAGLYMSPGVMTERIDCYVGAYRKADRVAPGGGVDADELIEVVEWPLARLAAAVGAGEVRDAKTVVIVQWLMLHRPELFDREGPAVTTGSGS